MKGKYTLHKKSHRYQLNFKLTLGAIASGIVPTNLARLSSFIDIPNVKAVNGRLFRKMELSVGPILRQVGTKAIEEALKEEIKLTLESKEKYSAWIEGNSPLSITISFDMGWNKRSSGNRYDSISGHAFLSVACPNKLSLPSSLLKFALSVQLLSLTVTSSRLTSAPETMMISPKGWNQTPLFTSIRGYTWVITKK